MNVAPELIQGLWAGRKVQIALPETDGLTEGKALFDGIQSAVPFRLCYLQVLGDEPRLLIWRSRDAKGDMTGYESQNGFQA